jgi:predicted secreted protein
MAELLSPSKIKTDDQGHASIVVTGHGIGGYKWSATFLKGDGSIDMVVDGASTDNIGGGAKLRFDVTCYVTGECAVKLSYGRPWEEASAMERIVTIASEK